MTYTIYSKIAHKTCLHKEIMFRNYKRFNIDSFRDALSQNDSISNTSWSADQFVDKWNDINMFLWILATVVHPWRRDV